jgi:hypothetical protein
MHKGHKEITIIFSWCALCLLGDLCGKKKYENKN